MIRPGEEIHFVALLDSHGDTLETIPMEEPLLCPEGAQDVAVDVKLKLTLHERAERKS